MLASSSDICLVYIENTKSFANVNGTTHFAQKVRSFQENNRLWHELQLLTDDDGDRIHKPKIITVLDNTIVSNRPIHDVQPHRFYQISNINDSLNFDNPVARDFVKKSIIKQPLASTSRSGLGSGLYGIFVPDPNDIKFQVSDPRQKVYQIDCSNPYIVQDKEHGDSITTASLHTNSYLDRLIEGIRTTLTKSIADPSTLIQLNSVENLVNLWNIVLFRTGQSITKQWLETILEDYINIYLGDNTLFDTTSQEPIQELPINHIMQELGFDGLLAKDSYNNRWNRGCVCYTMPSSVILRGSVAPY
jgi:hypothetical protein